MHSSRMRTVRSSGHILGGGVPGPGGGWYLVPGGVYLVWVGRGVPGLGMCAWLGVYLVLGGVPGLGGVPCPRGSAPWGGVYLVRYSPLCGQTDACKNITFATSLWTVIILLVNLVIFCFCLTVAKYHQ